MTVQIFNHYYKYTSLWEIPDVFSFLPNEGNLSPGATKTLSVKFHASHDAEESFEKHFFLEVKYTISTFFSRYTFKMIKLYCFTALTVRGFLKLLVSKYWNKNTIIKRVQFCVDKKYFFQRKLEFFLLQKTKKKIDENILLKKMSILAHKTSKITS